MAIMNGVTEKIIQKIEYFPHQPGVAYQILGDFDRLEITGSQLLRTLEFDIATTTNLLKLCNSPEYAAQHGLKEKFGSLQEVIAQLAIGELKNLVMMIASADIFAGGSGSGYEVGKGEMRRHSIATAVVSRRLLPFAPPLHSDLFTSCLLHDIGKMILNEYIWDHHAKLVALMDERGCDFSIAEAEILGMTHAEAGARILEKWQFPPEMISAVRYHHNPEHVPDSPLTHFVALADLIAMLMGFATGFDAMDYKGFPVLCKKYGIKEKDIELIMMNSIDEIQSAIPFQHENIKGV